MGKFQGDKFIKNYKFSKRWQLVVQRGNAPLGYGAVVAPMLNF